MARKWRGISKKTMTELNATARALTKKTKPIKFTVARMKKAGFKANKIAMLTKKPAKKSSGKKSKGGGGGGG